MQLSEYLLTISPFTPDELAEVISHFEEQHIPKNTILIQQGEICKNLYYMFQGIGRSYYLKEDGKEVTQWFFGKAKFMTSLESFFQQSRSLYYLETLEDCTLFSVSKESMDLLFAKYHKMEHLGRVASIEMLTKVVNKLNGIQFQTAKERYDYMLTEFPDLVHQVPLGHIASYLGMTQETLSRIRKS